MQNQLDGIARNNKSCLRKNFSSSPRAMNFRGSSVYGTDVSFLKTVSFFFQLFSSPHIFFVYSPVCICNVA